MAKQTGCVLNTNHAGECYVGTKTYDCGDAQQSAEIAQLRAENARLREAMPTDEERGMLDTLYRATVECVTGGGMFPATARAEDELAKARAWLARLDAARAEVGV
jgi:hypothetical protein